jgi:hypothetical protein
MHHLGRIVHPAQNNQTSQIKGSFSSKIIFNNLTYGRVAGFMMHWANRDQWSHDWGVEAAPKGRPSR